MKNNFSSRFLNTSVIIGILLTFLALLATPWMLSFRIDVVTIIIKISLGLYICSIPYILALFSLKGVCKKLSAKDPFSREIPKYLKQISMFAFSEILIFNITQLVLHNIFDIYLHGLSIWITIIVSFISLVIGFLSMILGNLFEVVIEIKDENDKTI